MLTDATPDAGCPDALPNYSDPQSVSRTTAAIQCRLNYAGISNDPTGVQRNSATIYFPPGIYYINKRLSLTPGYFAQNPDGSMGDYTEKYKNGYSRAAASVHLMGRSPTSAQIVWAGSCEKDPDIIDKLVVKYSSMLWVDGVVPDIERLTFDGHTCAGVAIDLTSEFNGISPAHIHELAIQNLKQVGIVGGRPELATYERHDVNGIVSEVSINQVSFKHIDYAGIAVLTPNALDYWIRDSYFEDCAIGITNAAAGAGWAYSYDEHIPGLPYLAPLPWGEKTSSGQFDVSNSVFKNSRVSDIVGNSGRIGVRNNYSSGSAGTFFQSYASFQSDSPIQPYLQGNTVIAGPAVPVALPNAKDFVTMIGNKFITGPSQAAFWVWTNQFGLHTKGENGYIGASSVAEKIVDQSYSNVVSISNQYTSTVPALLLDWNGFKASGLQNAPAWRPVMPAPFGCSLRASPTLLDKRTYCSGLAYNDPQFNLYTFDYQVGGSVATNELQLPPIRPEVTRYGIVAKLSAGDSLDNAIANSATLQRTVQTLLEAQSACSPGDYYCPARWGVLYLPSGAFPMLSTVTIPGNAQIQIVGAGTGSSTLYWSAGSSAAGTPMFGVSAPAKVIFRDFSISGPAGGGGITFEVNDTASSRVHTEEVVVGSFNVSNIGNVPFEMRDFQNSSPTGSPSTLTYGIHTIHLRP